MKKVYVLLSFICLVIILNACDPEKSGIKNNSVNLSKSEKELVNIEKEKENLELVFQTSAKLTPIEIGKHTKLFEPDEFKQFVPVGSKIGQVGTTFDGINDIFIDYFIGNERLIVTYFEDGTIHKTYLNRETGLLFIAK
ncbi:hypothetical protein GCM10008967_38400 [Bacillus carboniphilus]|uniref:Lipoprotein n=1 Tax=Bacillus carboniphilus TaxID=86663 RepID=A0ABP3GGH4_9BACI